MPWSKVLVVLVLGVAGSATLTLLQEPSCATVSLWTMRVDAILQLQLPPEADRAEHRLECETFRTYTRRH